MIKEDRPVFLKAVLITIIIILINLGYFVYLSQSSSVSTGFSIKSTFTEFPRNYTNMPIFNKLFLIVEVIFIGFLLTLSFRRDKNLFFIKESEIKIIRTNEPYKTDLDDLYNTLKARKELRLSTICRLFNISKDGAVEWARILENGDLAYVDYPSFGEPILKIKNKVETKRLV